MRTIEVTMEKTVSQVKEFEVTDNVYDEILRIRRIPDDMFEKMQIYLDENEKENGDVSYDYSVIDDRENQIINWG